MVAVTRWVPDIIDEIIDESQQGSGGSTRNIAEIVAKEAQKNLDKSEHKDAKKDEMLTQFEMGAINEEGNNAVQVRRERRKRVKIVSTPIGGGDMFSGSTEIFQPTAPLRRRRRVKTMSTPLSGDMWGDSATVVLGPGEVLVNVIGPNNEKYAAKMKEDTLKLLSSGGAPITLEKSVDNKQFTENYLDGFVRRKGRQRSLSNLSLTEEP